MANRLRLVLALAPGLVLGIGCGGDSEVQNGRSDGGGCQIGAEGCACTAGGGCDDGLTCLSQKCVQLPDGSVPPDAADDRESPADSGVDAPSDASEDVLPGDDDSNLPGGYAPSSDEAPIEPGGPGTCAGSAVPLKIQVPWLPQVPPGNWTETMNCGPAAYAMIDGFFSNTTPNADTIKLIDDWMAANVAGWSINNYSGNAGGTTTAELAKLASEYGVYQFAEKFTSASCETLRAELAAGRPIIVTIETQTTNNYPSTTMKPGHGHFAVLGGMDHQYVYIFDPGRSAAVNGCGDNCEGRRFTLDSFYEIWSKHGRSGTFVRESSTTGCSCGNGICETQAPCNEDCNTCDTDCGCDSCNYCDGNGVCSAKPADCGGKECGVDACGNSCGSCPVGAFCNTVQGQCEYSCPSDCLSHGVCDTSTGNCECDNGYAQPDCGSCLNGYHGYPNCTPDIACPGGGTCSGHGTCNGSTGTCSCQTGYALPDCASCATGYHGYPNCTPDIACPGGGTCSGHGSCDGTTGTCSCQTGYALPDCASCATGYHGYPNCTPDIACPGGGTCSGHGSCDGTTGTCSCQTGYALPDCASCATGYHGYPNCTPDIACPGGGTCSGHGSCDGTTGTCSCQTGYALPDCGSCSSGYVNYPNCTLCTVNWSCSWSSCAGGNENAYNCVDLNGCGSSTGMPTSRSCPLRIRVRRMFGGNGFGCGNPAADWDHCPSLNGTSCLVGQNSNWTYALDPGSVDFWVFPVGEFEAGDPDTVNWEYPLVRLDACYNASVTRHVLEPTDRLKALGYEQNTANTATGINGWTCVKVGYIRVGSVVAGDSYMIPIYRNEAEDSKSTTFYQPTDATDGTCSIAGGVAWYAWNAE